MPTSSLLSVSTRLLAVSLLASAAASSQAQSRFTTSADGQEVSDASTRLTWRRCAEGLRWDGKACSGKLLRFSYAGAKDAGAKAAKSDGKSWRIPARDELVALVDAKAKKPKIDAQAFPQTPAAPFWAAREGRDDNLSAWLVNFSSGKVRGNTGQAKFPLRLVRPT